MDDWPSLTDFFLTAVTVVISFLTGYFWSRLNGCEKDNDISEPRYLPGKVMDIAVEDILQDVDVDAIKPRDEFTKEEIVKALYDGAIYRFEWDNSLGYWRRLNVSVDQFWVGKPTNK